MSLQIHKFFEARRAAATPLVLATVYDTAGSTYSKAGGYMLIDGDGRFTGMLSGGRLEGDLAERARAVIDTGSALSVTYDLGADDEIWGLGVGCDGTMKVLLQPLSPDNEYQPFAEIMNVLHGGPAADVAIVVGSESPGIAAGAAVIVRGDLPHIFGMDDSVAQSILAHLADSKSGCSDNVTTPAGACSVLTMRVRPSPSLLVLGAGLDSEPLVNIAVELGWRCTVADHRESYVGKRSYPAGVISICSPADQVGSRTDLGEFDMAIVMSHHLASDRAYLGQLAFADIGYVGLLGPAGRKERLMSELHDVADMLEHRLHGPAGVPLGGRGPAAIALEIAAEMQQYLCKRRQVGRRVDVD